MDFDAYLREFRFALDGLDKARFGDAGLEVFTGIVMKCAALKVYKPE